MARTYNFEKVSMIDEYALDPNNGLRQMKDHMVLSDAKTLAPTCFAYYNAVGWPDDKIMCMTASDAANEDYIWGTSGLPFMTPDGTLLDSGSHGAMYWGPGKFGTATMKHFAFGRYDFHGTHPYYGKVGVPAGSTEFVLLNDVYLDDPALKLVIADLGTTAHQLRPVFGSTTAGKSSMVAGYNEAAQFGRVCITTDIGNGYFKPGVLRIAMLAWDMGSNSFIDNLRTHGFDTPVMCVRGTPARFGAIHSFNASISPLMLIGCAQNSIDVQYLECDDAPNATMMRPGFGREAGARLHIGEIKIEGAVTPENAEGRGPWQPVAVGDYQGQYSVFIGMVNNSHGWARQDTAFRLSHKLQDGSKQANSLTVGGIDGFGYDNLIHDLDTGELISSPGDNAGCFFSYSSDGTLITNMPARLTRKTSILVNGIAKPISPARLGMSRYDAASKSYQPPFDKVAGTPLLDYTGGVAAPPVGTVTTVVASLSATTIPQNATAQATAVVKDQNGNVMNGVAIAWSASGAGTINASGVITPTMTGTIIVTATCAGKTSAQVVLSVTAAVSAQLAKYVFSGSPADGSKLVATVGNTLTAQQAWERAAIVSGKLSVTNGNARYPLLAALSNVKRIVLTNLLITADGGFICDRINLFNGKWYIDGATEIGNAPPLNVLQAVATINVPAGTVISGLLTKQNAGNALRCTLGQLELYSN